MNGQIYRVVVTQSAKRDVADKKRYILRKFQYREYAESFSKNIRKAVESLDLFPAGYKNTGFRYRGYDVFLCPACEHLIFYIINEDRKTVNVIRILQDGMDWEEIIRKWLSIHS